MSTENIDSEKAGTTTSTKEDEMLTLMKLGKECNVQ